MYVCRDSFEQDVTYFHKIVRIGPTMFSVLFSYIHITL